MGFAKIFKFAKKGSKKVKKSRGGGAAAPVKWPEGIRVGVFGHENSGKTVFFTSLYTKSKSTKDFQISVRDNATASEFFKNDMAIKGVDCDSSGTGTIAARPVPKKFPDPTEKDIILQFTAILDGNTKIPVVSYDYSGRAVAISEHSDDAEKIRDFMVDADGLLFFFDPKILGADPEVQARASTFINILERIVPLRSRLPIPVGLVISKSDILPGYNGEDQSVLIQPEDEQVIAEDYEKFLEKVLDFESFSENREWATSVRNVLVKLREFIRIVVGRTLDFQIFFVSSTGNRPEKIGVDVGRSIYAPPEKVNPCGVTRPFYWILNSIVRSQRLNVMRRIAGYVSVASIIWILLFSLPYLFHFGGFLRSAYRVENSVLNSVDGNILNTSDAQRSDIIRAYNRYGNKMLVRKMFTEYRLTSSRMRDVYSEFSLGPAVARLDSIITGFADIISDPKLQPKYDQGLDSLILSDTHRRLVGSLERMHVGEKTSVLYMRSDRVFYYWDLFTKYVKNPADTSVLEKINYQVNFNLENAQNYSESEKRLGSVLLGVLDIPVSRSVPTVRATASNLNEYNQIKDKVNGSSDPAYVLGEVPAKLSAVRDKLSASTNSTQISAINAFLAEAKKWEKRRTYTCVLQTVPDMGHLHIEVTGSGGNPSWSNETQLLEGDEIKLKWKPGDDVHIAIDELRHECNWGKKPSDRVVFQDKYAIFEAEGSIAFPNINKTIILSFKGGLKERLPKLK
ncbi:MAG: GTPase domain-containing protein [Bacteroidales bacterium]|nr:GTPase domain-containing protein [Candidatus Latescibacterota bacterium]